MAERAESGIRYVDEERLEVADVSEEVDRVLSSSKSVDKVEASCFICAKGPEMKYLVMDDIEAASSLKGEAMRGYISTFQRR